MVFSAGLILAGLFLQISLSQFFIGFVPLLFGSLLGIVEGYDAKYKTSIDRKWERVTPDEYKKVKEKAGLLEKWDQNSFDATNTTGTAVFAAVAVIAALIYIVLAHNQSIPVSFARCFAADCAALFLPHWLAGNRYYLKKDRLIIKINLLEKIMQMLASPSNVQVFPMLEVGKTDSGKQAPEDARLMIRLLSAPKEFYGVQAQISINSVQGKDYPYLYCVLIAKKGSELLEGYKSFAAQPASFVGGILDFFGLGALGSAVGSAPNVVYEESSDSEVDVLVIRQRTSRNSGYFTNAAAAGRIVSSAIELAEKLFKQPLPAAAASAGKPAHPAT